MALLQLHLPFPSLTPHHWPLATTGILCIISLFCLKGILKYHIPIEERCAPIVLLSAIQFMPWFQIDLNSVTYSLTTTDPIQPFISFITSFLNPVLYIHPSVSSQKYAPNTENLSVLLLHLLLLTMMFKHHQNAYFHRPCCWPSLFFSGLFPQLLPSPFSSS